MYCLHLDDMLELAMQQQAELRRQAAQEVLVAQIGHSQARWSAVIARLWATITQRPRLRTEDALWPKLTDSACRG